MTSSFFMIPLTHRRDFDKWVERLDTQWSRWWRRNVSKSLTCPTILSLIPENELYKDYWRASSPPTISDMVKILAMKYKIPKGVNDG